MPLSPRLMLPLSPRRMPRIRVATAAVLVACGVSGAVGTAVLYEAAAVGASRSQPQGAAVADAAQEDGAISVPTAAQAPALAAQAPGPATEAPAPLVQTALLADATTVDVEPPAGAAPVDQRTAALGQETASASAASALDGTAIAQARAEDEASEALGGARRSVVTPAAPAVVRSTRPSEASLVGRLAKVAPSPDGLPARLRAEPTTTAKVMARVPEGAAVRVLGPSAGGWLHVRWNGLVGYVHADLLR